MSACNRLALCIPCCLAVALPACTHTYTVTASNVSQHALAVSVVREQWPDDRVTLADAVMSAGDTFTWSATHWHTPFIEVRRAESDGDTPPPTRVDLVPDGELVVGIDLDGSRVIVRNVQITRPAPEQDEAD